MNKSVCKMCTVVSSFELLCDNILAMKDLLFIRSWENMLNINFTSELENAASPIYKNVNNWNKLTNQNAKSPHLSCDVKYLCRKTK